MGLTLPHLISVNSVKSETTSRYSSVSRDTVETILCRLCSTGTNTLENKNKSVLLNHITISDTCTCIWTLWRENRSTGFLTE